MSVCRVLCREFGSIPRWCLTCRAPPIWGEPIVCVMGLVWHCSPQWGPTIRLKHKKLSQIKIRHYSKTITKLAVLGNVSMWTGSQVGHRVKRKPGERSTVWARFFPSPNTPLGSLSTAVHRLGNVHRGSPAKEISMMIAWPITLWFISLHLTQLHMGHIFRMFGKYFDTHLSIYPVCSSRYSVSGKTTSLTPVVLLRFSCPKFQILRD